MAKPILPNFPPKESNKTESVPNLGICRDQAPIITKSIHTLDAHNLPGTAGYLAEILEETILNLTRIHEYLTKIENMLLKGGGR
jgi:hypothetical protein